MTTTLPIFSHTIQSPIGQITLHATHEVLVELKIWPNDSNNTVPLQQKPAIPQKTPLLAEVEHQLQLYFSGQLQTFSLPVSFTGTNFQKSIWKALQNIPYGTLTSYSDIAQSISRPKAVRAAGQMIGKNPIPIIVPCHRVIGKNGHLTGFFYGIPMKSWLLSHEGCLIKK